MNRLQQKCVIVSAGLHLLLLVIIVVGPAFVFSRSRPTDNLPVLQVIPDILTDKPSSGGGNPEVKLPPPIATPPTPAPPVVNPPEPIAVPKKAAPPPPAPRTVERERPPSKVPDVMPTKTGKRTPDISTNLVIRKTDTKAQEKAQRDAEAAAAARQQREEANRRSQIFSNVARVLNEGASSATKVDLPGPGGGGPASVNYGQAVKSVFMREWRPPASIEDETATTLAEIIIARDGTVISARIIRPSGNAAADASVRRTLERVRSVPAFPEGAPEERRSYNLEFNIEAKRLLG